MKYQYEYDLNDLADLEHIRWVAEHMEDYEFHGNTTEIRDKLLSSITKKNVYYSDCVNQYRDFCEAFDNNPYNYITEVLDVGENYISSAHTDHYFVSWEEKNVKYTVPIAYMMKTQRKTERQKLEGLVNRGREACGSVFANIRQKSGEALDEIEEYIGAMEMTLPQRKKEVKTDLLVFFLAWVLLLWNIHNHVWFQEIASGIKGHRKVGELLHQVFLETEDKKILIIGIVIVIAGICLLILTARFYKKQVVLSCMEQITDYGTRLRELKETANEAEKILYEPVKIKLEKSSHVPELTELAELSCRRLSFGYPRNLKPEDYCVYGCTLWKAATWVLFINVAVAAISIL